MKQNFLSVVAACLVVMLSFSSNFSYAQVTGVVRCWSSEFDSIRHANDPNLQSNEEFEAWMKKLIMQDKATPKPKLVINGVYQIPVIVHIIHNGEAVGTGTNLSAAVVQSQIDVLNEDFRRIFGTSGYNTHPDGADTQIEFCLAKRRPNGTAFPPGEDGINRINRNTQGWGAPPYTTAFVDGTIKPYTIATQGYDAAIYMNFWSVNLSGGILGYAQFPTTSLGGMSCAPQSVNTDGVVMLYSSIGKSSVTGQPGPYNEGRTATHEIGHWLGLRHIWGDGGCGVDDFCADTPLSDAANFGCPTTNSCTDPAPDPNDMVQNYMDYTDDLCMNIFTNDQKTRMRLVLENSPIRASLINSNACIPPAVSDASIVNIINPKGDNCPGSIVPTVTIKNRGSSNLTSATINYTIDNGPVTSMNWTGNIAPNAQLNVPVTAFSAPLGVRTIRAYTTLPNGVIDPNPAQDTTTLQFAISNGYQPNYTQDFEATTFVPDVRWAVDNPTNDCFEWIGQSCVSSTGVATNNAAMMPNFGNSSGLDDYLYTPIFILPCNATAASLRFNRAYRRRANGVNDRLRVEISEDCGATWNAVTLYDQNGTGLQTVTTVSNSYWIPSASTDWANVNLNLLSYVTGTSKNVQFRFRATNTGGSGGNIYIDDVQFLATTPAEIEVNVAGVDVLDDGLYNFGPVGVGGSTTATFTIQNTGTSNLILTGPISVTGTGFALGSTFGTTTVPAGGSTTFTVTFSPTAAGPFSGNVSFGTNDCDEGTYNFQLQGVGSVSPPVADFSGSPLVICAGSSVTFTNLSTNATTYSWSFPGGTPATSTATNPTIVYNTAGTYNVVLTATNAFGNDVETKNAYVTVNAATAGTAPPISEGFAGATFAPAGWSVVNGGTANTWVRVTTAGIAPTPGNAAQMDNFSGTNSSGAVDDLRMLPVNLTGLSSATLTFDVAYARYSAANSETLEVLVSNNCGGSFTTVFTKAGSTLATAPDQTTAFTPTAAQWRNETIDLTPYIGAQKVDIIFRNISGWGNNLYLDNINLTGVTSTATANFTAAPNPACTGQNVTFTNTSVGATSWNWNFGAGATPATATGAGPHVVTYATAGTKNVSLSVNAGASTSNQTVTITAPPVAGTLSGTQNVCVGLTTTFASTQGGGTWSTSNGAIATVNASTGVVTGVAAGTATITYTVAGTGGCPDATATRTVTVTAAPVAGTLSGTQNVCVGLTTTFASTQGGGTWSTSNGAIATVNASTGVVTGVAAGTATITYTVAGTGGCPNATATRTVTVTAAPVAGTLSGTQNVCVGLTTTFASTQGGGTWSTSNGAIATVNASTGVVTGVAAGTATITYTVAGTGGCPNATAMRTVTVTAAPVAGTLSGTQNVCVGLTTTFASTQGGGSWSTSNGAIATVNASTGVVTGVSAGTATITYTVTGTGGCPNATATRTVTVTAAPVAGTLSGTQNVCVGLTTTFASTQGGGTWSTSNGAIATVNASTGVVTGVSAGTATITYITGTGGCPNATATRTVTVTAAPVAGTLSGTQNVCVGLTTTFASTQGGGTWSTSNGAIATVNASTGVVTGVSAGTATITYTVTGTGGCPNATATRTVTVNALPATPTITASGPTTFCAGGSVTLTSSQATGNVWSTGATTQSIVVSASGSYSVTFTNGSGCSSTSTATTVTVNAAPATPTITTSGPTTFCAGGSVTLTSSQATGNVWSTGATTQSISVTTSGNYAVQYTDGNGCSAISATTAVTVNSAPVIATGTISSPSACGGSNGSIQITGSGNGTVSWTGTASGSSGAITLPYTITGLSAGSYSVTFVSGSGCTSNTLTPAVSDPTPPATPTITASGPTTFCAGGSVTLTSSQATGNVWSTGATTQSIVVSASGSYSVTFTNGSGCSSTSTATTVTVNAAPATPTITASGPTTFCAGGSVTLTSSQATGNVWSTGATTQSISVTTSGNYAVQYTDGNGCSAISATTAVTVNAAPATPTITASGPTTFCAGGSVTLTSSQATGNVWSTGATTQSISVTTSGNYAVQYTDGNGCSAISATTAVTVNSAPAAPTITASGPTTFCAGGSVTLTSSQATGNVWSTGATTQSISVTTSGNYAVQYTDGNGCSAISATTAVTVNSAPATPTITASGPTTFCAGGSVTLTSSQATGNVWSTGATTQSISVTTSGNYAVQYTDGNGCSAISATTAVTVNSAPATPTITASGPTTFCAGGSVDLTSSSATGNGWSNLQTTQTITATTSGSYSVTVTDGNGCQATSAPTVVTVNAAPATPTITASGPTTFCAGGSVDLTSSSATGNGWSNLQTTQTITATTSGSYSVTVTDGNGCQATSTPTVVTVNAVPATPTITASGPTTFCAGGSVDLTSSSATGNGWSNLQTTQTITATTSGSYSVTVTDGNGCQATSTPTVVTVNAAPATPTITASGPTTFCAGGSVDLTSSQASGNVWSNGLTTQTISVTTSGNYAVQYTDGNGCSAISANVSVTVNSLPSVNAGADQSVCEGELVTLTGAGAQSYTWDNGVSNGVAFAPSATNTYTVTGTDANGCSGSDVVIVTVNPLPVVSLSTLFDTTCTNSITVTLTGTPAGGVYTGTGVTGNQFDPGVAGVGSFTQVYEYTDANGCSGSATSTIVVEDCLDLDENAFSSLEIYPNPMTNEFTIELDGSFTYDLVDARGRLVAKGAGTNEVVVNTANYEMGVYFVNVYTSQNSTTVRVLKQ